MIVLYRPIFLFRLGLVMGRVRRYSIIGSLRRTKIRKGIPGEPEKVPTLENS